MSFPRYPEYKESGVEWLGEVPVHWSVPPVYLRYAVQLGKMLDTNRITGEHLTPYLRNVDVQWGRVNVEELPSMDIAPDEFERFTVSDGDLLVCEGGEVGRAAVVMDMPSPIGYQKALHRLRANGADESVQYLFYVFRWVASVGGFAGEGQSTIAHLTGEQLRKYRFPKPPIGEQTTIAAFLDRETAKIDALVAEQETLIALLKEKRQAVISHAVTKGLNPDAPMKPSGIEWLGDVPAHWEMARLKNVSPFITVGIVVNPSDYVSDDGLPFIYGGDISEGNIAWDTARRISPEHSEKNSKTKLDAGDLLTVRVGAPGVTAVVGPECEGGNCASVMLTRRGNYDSYWLCFAMNSRMVRFQVEVVQYGAAQEQFNISHAINFWIALPPTAEQSEIVAGLTRESGAINSLISEADRAITLLKERRSALISAAVTGQIDLRGLAPA